MNVPTDEKFITKEEVVEKLGISMNCLYVWMKKGFPSYKINGLRRFLWSEVVEWVKETNRQKDSA